MTEIFLRISDKRYVLSSCPLNIVIVEKLKHSFSQFFLFHSWLWIFQDIQSFKFCQNCSFYSIFDDFPPVLCTQLVEIVSGHLICEIVFVLVKSEHSILIGLNHVWNSIWVETGRLAWLIYGAWREIFPAGIRRLVVSDKDGFPWTARPSFLSPSCHLLSACWFQ